MWVYKISGIGAQRGAPEPVIKCTPLLVNGVLYITIPDHLYALDARTAKLLWQPSSWVDHGGHPGRTAAHGVAIWQSTVYFQTPDNWLIALDANSGKELWRKNYADARKQYFSTSAPLIVKNHVLMGVGGDAMDMPGFLNAYDPATGKLQWTWWSTPRKGDPALKTWPNEAASEHGGGMTWMPGTYDPKLNLLFWPTGNTNPGVRRAGPSGQQSVDRVDRRAECRYRQGSNGITRSRRTTPMTSTTTPSRSCSTAWWWNRKTAPSGVPGLAAAAYFFTLDRVTGKYLVAKPFVPLDYVSGLSANGEPIPIPDKDPQVGGSINIVNATNWPNPAYNRDAGLFYVNSVEGKSIYYLVDDSENPSGYGGTGAGHRPSPSGC